MTRTEQERIEIINTIHNRFNTVRAGCMFFGIHLSTYYQWKNSLGLPKQHHSDKKVDLLTPSANIKNSESGILEE